MTEVELEVDAKVQNVLDTYLVPLIHVFGIPTPMLIHAIRDEIKAHIANGLVDPKLIFPPSKLDYARHHFMQYIQRQGNVSSPDGHVRCPTCNGTGFVIS